jgi:hypothetical protein
MASGMGRKRSVGDLADRLYNIAHKCFLPVQRIIPATVNRQSGRSRVDRGVYENCFSGAALRFVDMNHTDDKACAGADASADWQLLVVSPCRAMCGKNSKISIRMCT